jgi:oxalate decarboxylase
VYHAGFGASRWIEDFKEMKMDTDNSNGQVSRRGFLGVSSAALATASSLFSASGAAAQNQNKSQNASGDRTKSDPGPANPALDGQNPDSIWPPSTDSKSLVQNFKYPFSFANKRVYEGGWSREVTFRELPVSKTLAGVNMRLNAGGVRELHWHTAAEWAIMLYGSARITAIDNDGRSFIADTNKYDLWFFPSGIPHSIQGLDPDGCEFMLVFDDGNFSESETVLLSDAMAHIPREVLAKNFRLPEQTFQNVPKEELFILQTAVPGSLESDQQAAAGSLPRSPIDYAFRTLDMHATKSTKGGDVRIVDSSNFKVTTTSMALVTLHPGGLRELHWHQNADEWQYYISGKGRMTVISTGNKARTMDFQAGDVGYVEKTLLHYIENTGDSDLVFLEMFKSPVFQDLSFTEWLTHTPPELVLAHLKIDRAAYDAIPRSKAVIIPE